MDETRDYPVNENAWKNGREIVQEIPYPEFWTLDFAKKWSTEIPDSLEMQGTETPLIELDLTKDGFGRVLIKNEADRKINPTGTIKDRLARSCAAIYHHTAKDCLEFLENDPRYKKRFAEKRINRYSMLTAGNAGMALARAMEGRDLPPPKLLLDKNVSYKILAELKKTKADIYLVDLSKNTFSGRPSEEDPLMPYQILMLTNNVFGTDLTSTNSEADENPHIAYYQNLAKQILKQKPDEVYVPYGSGALFGEILIAQRLIRPLEIRGRKATEEEKELGKHMGRLSLFGAEPESNPSIADKLYAHVKPFPTRWENDLAAYKQEQETGPRTGVKKISEEEIKNAFELLKLRGKSLGVETEPSASAGLALYMKRWKAGKVKKDAKVIVVNTGKGIISDEKP
jgi:hypothetical protein